MNRPVLYRVFHKIEKKMYPVAEITCGNQQVPLFGIRILTLGVGNEDPEVKCLEKDSFELMQFTGLQDIRQNPIYEDDLLKNDAGEIFRVEWCDAWAGFILNRGKVSMFEPFSLTSGAIKKEKFIVYGNYYIESIQ